MPPSTEQRAKQWVFRLESFDEHVLKQLNIASSHPLVEKLCYARKLINSRFCTVGLIRLHSRVRHSHLFDIFPSGSYSATRDYQKHYNYLRKHLYFKQHVFVSQVTPVCNFFSEGSLPPKNENKSLCLSVDTSLCSDSYVSAITLVDSKKPTLMEYVSSFFSFFRRKTIKL